MASSTIAKKKKAPVISSTYTTCMEQLQEGYVFSVAATAGCTVERIQRDVYGIDITILRKGDNYTEEQMISLQLKCTATFKPDPTKDEFSYQLKHKKTLYELAKKRERIKAVLLVMTTDPDQALWSSSDHDSLAIVNCCYWAYFEGYDADSAPANPTLKIPTANVFDAGALTHLMDTLGRGVAP